MELKVWPIQIRVWGLVANVVTLAIVISVTAAASWGQALPLALARQTLDAQQGDVTACQNGLENCNLLSTTPQPPKGNSEKARLAVNPVTGLVSTPTANYRALTGRERWKLYWKQNYLSIGAYFGPVFTALVLDQSTGSPQQWGAGFTDAAYASPRGRQVPSFRARFKPRWRRFCTRTFAMWQGPSE
jgi:hypothetical protein